MPLRVLVVAARPSVRAGLGALLLEEGVQVVDQVGRLVWQQTDSPDETALVAADAIVLDPTDGVAEVEESARIVPGVPLVVLGPVVDEARLIRALGDRPWGYLPREAGGAQIAAAIRAVVDGLVTLDRDLASRMIGGTTLLRSDESGSEELTPREREVLQLVAAGLPNKTIASRLHISEHTVKFHVAAILTRLGANSRTEAVRIGARRGWVEL